MHSLHPDELRGARALWLLTVESLGRTWRFSSAPCVISDRAGDEWVFDGGLPPVEVELGASPSDTVAEAISVTVEVHWPGAAAAVGVGRPLLGLAELAWTVEGALMHRRRVLLRGRMTIGEHGADGESVLMTIEQDPGTETQLVPDVSHNVNTDAWVPDTSSSPAGPLPSHEGAVIPLVFGAPGPYRVYDTRSAAFGAYLNAPGSPAWAVECTTSVTFGGEDEFRALTVAIAQHHVAATTGTLLYKPPSTTGASTADGWYRREGLSISNRYDALGRAVATVDLSGETADVQGASEFFWVWGDYDSQNAALRGDDFRAVRGVGSVAIWLLRRSSIPYDAAAWERLRTVLDAWRVDTYLDEAVGPYDYLVSTLLKSLPVSLVQTGAGVAPVLWNPDMDEASVVDHLRVRSDCSRASAVRVLMPGAKAIHVEYSVDASTGEYRQSVQMSPEPDVDAGVVSSVWARRADDLAVRPADESLSVAWTYDRATVLALASWRAALAAGWREVDIDVDQERGWLRVGDQVLVTDAEVGMNGARAQVARQIVRVSGVITLTLVVWSVSARSSSSVPLTDTVPVPQ